MTPSDIAVPAAEAIHAGQRHRFRHLASNGIRKSVLDEFESFLAAAGTLSRPSLIVRCRVTGHVCDIRVVVDKAISRVRLTRSFEPFVTRVLDRIRRPADFFVLMSDNVYASERSRGEFVEFLRNVPFLRCDQRDDDEISAHAVLIPDFSVLAPEYAAEFVAIENTAAANPFERRLDVVKWRGSFSGPVYPDLDNYLDFPRYRLLTMSMRHPGILDARLTTYDNMPDGEASIAVRRCLRATFGPLADHLPAEAFVRYKYLISVDGAVAAWKRVPTILASGSVLLLQHRWTQFFYPGLQPWVHYVPVAHDLADLLDRYAWLAADPPRAKTIAGNGQRFAREILHPTALERFFVDTVDRCGELYRA
jgi:hypothetical protein